MNSRLVIYHDHCIDGFTAAWVAWSRFVDADTEYMGASHGDAPPDVRGREVWILDFSYPRNVLLEMASVATSIRVLDHHKTAQDALTGLPFATFDMNRSGAGLAWDVLHSDVRPWLVDYVEDRDLWRFAWPESKEVNAWIGAHKRDSFDTWQRLYERGIIAAAENGAGILMHIGQYVEDVAALARIIAFAGYRVPIVNAPFVNISELVGKLAESAPFAIGWHQRSDGAFVYSLRSRGPDGIDVSEIAKRYHGGGHRNAAGFVLSTMLPEDP